MTVMRVLAWLLVFCGVLFVVGPVVVVRIDRARCTQQPTAQAVRLCRAEIPAIGFLPATIGLVTIGLGGALLLAESPPISFRRGGRR